MSLGSASLTDPGCQHFSESSAASGSSNCPLRQQPKQPVCSNPPLLSLRNHRSNRSGGGHEGSDHAQGMADGSWNASWREALLYSLKKFISYVFFPIFLSFLTSSSSQGAPAGPHSSASSSALTFHPSSTAVPSSSVFCCDKWGSQGIDFLPLPARPESAAFTRRPPLCLSAQINLLGVN